jgi:transketolase
MPPEYRFQFGKATVLEEGTDITLIGTGLMVSRCIEAGKILKRQGISAEVINCSSIKPLDEQTLIKSASKTHAVIVAENHSIIGGVGSAIAELLSEKRPVLVKKVGVNDRYGQSGSLEDLLADYGLTTKNVVDAAIQVLEHEPKKKHKFVDGQTKGTLAK